MTEHEADVTIPEAPIGERTLTELLILLRRPFPPTTFQSRQTGDRLERYTPIGAVIDRLNRAAGAWNFTVVGATLESLPGPHGSRTEADRMCIVVGELAIPGLGARQAHGMAAWEGSDDPLAQAEADALRHAAGLFSLPLIEGEGEDQPSGPRRSQRAPTRARSAKRLR